MHRAFDRLRTLKVADVMARQVVTVTPDQSLESATELFVTKDVSSAPVLDQQQRCIGVLSAVDFLKRGVTGACGGTNGKAGASGTVADLMSHGVRSVAMHESLFKAAQLMCAKHIHRLPVVGEGGRVVGVISTMDIVAAMLNAWDEADAAQFLPVER